MLAGWMAAGSAASGAEHFVQNREDLARIEAALPPQAPARPAKPRRLLIFTLNVGYGGHASIAYANEAFTRMGRRTGAFDAVVSNDPAVFARESLSQFDAVFFNNTVGNCFTNAEWRQSLAEFVMGGGGLMGVHGTSVAFTRWPGAVEDWPEFGLIIGARGANHKESDEHAWLKLEDPEHPVTRAFGGQDFDYREEFFRVHEPYSRERLRVLLSLDTAKTDMDQGQPRGNTTRADNDYAIAWAASYGRGRVFYCTMAHNARVFWDARMLEFYLAAAQFVLGDLPAPTTPSARLTPAVRAQERLGWRLGLAAGHPARLSLSETIDHAARLGLSDVWGADDQLVSKETPRPLGPALSRSELEAVRLKLAAQGMRLVAFQVQDFPAAQAERRSLFEFGRKLGVEVLIGHPPTAALGEIGRLCDQFNLRLALHDCTEATAEYAQLEKLRERCQTLGGRMGAGGCLRCWSRAGVDPAQAVRALNQRLFTVRLNNSPGAGQPASPATMLAEARSLGLGPTLFALELSEGDTEAVTQARQRMQQFNQLTLQLAPGPAKP
jgi:hypothetical protein